MLLTSLIKGYGVGLLGEITQLATRKDVSGA